MRAALPQDGPVVWVARELHEQWQREVWRPRPGFRYVAEVVITETPVTEQPRETVPYRLVPVREGVTDA